jgi:hypothetical protein
LSGDPQTAAEAALRLEVEALEKVSRAFFHQLCGSF